MSHSDSLLKKIVEGIIVTVVGGLILAYFVQEGRFAPRPTPTVPPTSVAISVMTSPGFAPTDAGSFNMTELPAATPQSIVSTGTIGNSVLGRSIDFTRIGNGSRIIVIAGGLHGIEPNAAKLVDDMKAYFEANQGIIANDFTFYFLPRLNPDGLAAKDRYNANGVDLNRNWKTSNWQTDTEDNKAPAKGRGGTAPFSEPETAAFANFLLNLNQQRAEPLIVFNYHARHPPSGLVQPSYRIENQNQISDPAAYALAKEFAGQLGYEFSPFWDEYQITGEAIHWCGENGILCMDIELPTLENLTSFETQKHESAILEVIQK